jgi:hypothetical protein
VVALPLDGAPGGDSDESLAGEEIGEEVALDGERLDTLDLDAPIERHHVEGDPGGSTRPIPPSRRIG